MSRCYICDWCNDFELFDDRRQMIFTDEGKFLCKICDNMSQEALYELEVGDEEPEMPSPDAVSCPKFDRTVPSERVTGATLPAPLKCSRPTCDFCNSKVEEIYIAYGIEEDYEICSSCYRSMQHDKQS